MKAHGFRVCFTPLLEVLFTFPSRYLSTIGLSVVFSLAGWAPLIPAEFLVLRGTQVPSCPTAVVSRTGLSPSTDPLSRGFRYSDCVGAPTVLQPRARLRNRPGLGCCAFARHYLRNHCYFLFLRVLRCFSSPGSPTASMRCDGITSIGFPHSDIRGSRGICPSPRLFAACHVLLRLREPQASPMRPFSLSLVSSNGTLSACPPDGGPRRGRAFSTLVVVARFLFQLDFSLRFRDTPAASGAGRLALYSSRSQHVNDLILFFSPVVPGRLELPTSTLSV